MNNQTFARIKVKQWGVYAFARYCRNLGIEFDGAFYMIFGRYPTR